MSRSRPSGGVGSVHAMGERPRCDRGVVMAACSSLRCAGRISVTAAGSAASVKSRKRVAVTEPASVIVAVHVRVVPAQAPPYCLKIAPVSTFAVSNKPFTGKADGVECCRRPACRKPCSRRETK